MTRRTRTALLALLAGIALAAATVGTILWVTNDMRWILLAGSLGLFAGTWWTANRRRGGVLALLLVSLPLLALYTAAVLPQMPGLWGHLVVWLLFALLGWWGFRSSAGGAAAGIVVFAVVAAVAGAAWYGLSYVPAEISRTLNQVRNEPAPVYRLVTLEGDEIPVSSLEGKVVLLDFFATWCAPCIAELPEIEALHRRYSDAPDVEILVVANDSGGDTPDGVRAFAEGRDLRVPFLYDPGGRAHAAFDFTGLPALALIDASGRLRFTRQGFNAAEADFQEHLVERIESLRTDG